MFTKQSLNVFSYKSTMSRYILEILKGVERVVLMISVFVSVFPSENILALESDKKRKDS
mgnify:CR=1 FL=1